MRTAVALRHMAFEDLGLLQPWLETRGWRIRYHDVGVDDFARLDESRADLLIVLGGPISVEEDDRYPFLSDEVEIVWRRLAAQRPALGICLGAQLMARALGARVRQMGRKEIGYAPLAINAAGQQTPIAEIGDQPVLHWHGDQFDLPPDLPSLARTSACPHQAFMVGQHAMAWQFHLEFDARRIEQWLIGHTGELLQAGIETSGLREAAFRHQQGLERALDSVMSRWFQELRLT